MIDKLLDYYCVALTKLMAVLLAMMVVMVFTNVVLRYAFNSGISVTEELSRWLFVWMTFAGAIVAVREHGHLGTDFLVGRLPVMGKKICLVIGYILMLYMCWLMLQGSWAQTLINMKTAAPATGWSQGWFYGTGVVFAVSAGVMLLLDLYKLVTGQVKDEDLIAIKESEEQTHGADGTKHGSTHVAKPEGASK
jgi:TRAP-type transport system small permease protein